MLLEINLVIKLYANVRKIVPFPNGGRNTTPLDGPSVMNGNATVALLREVYLSVGTLVLTKVKRDCIKLRHLIGQGVTGTKCQF